MIVRHDEFFFRFEGESRDNLFGGGIVPSLTRIGH